MSEEYLTVREVAERLKVTRQAVYNWIADGRLVSVKLGRSVRITERALQVFLQRGIRDENAPPNSATLIPAM